ncbi:MULTISPECIES: hypothetical protein [Acidithiobacillus]|uniref:hypothetical protein n=1 Tax=Acidithiobacillus TaxID=119977 RepID=UPI00094AB881|nr:MULTISPECIES: hypothetical protein [Acidithiobacillus]MBE7563702.1 hypothetical protein [Acidithiobacillus sp. HP-6]MBE7569419.1 hypothetical protein [Acidithiobacillus sp. HP-2]
MENLTDLTEINEAQYFDVDRTDSSGAAALDGITAILSVLRGDVSNDRCADCTGRPAVRLSPYTAGGLIEAIEVLTEVARTELDGS